MPVYECQVGHRFSIFSLSEGKEDQVESALWSAIALVEHIQTINDDVIATAASRPRGRLIEEARKRREQARDQISTLGLIVEETRRPQLDEE